MIDKRAKGNMKRGHFAPARSLILLILTIFAGSFLGFLAFYLVMYVDARKGTALLPNYVGVDVQVAKDELSKKGFRVEIIGESGRVIKMDPPGNTVVKQGRKVKLFAQSIVEKSIILPDFKGIWYKSVQNILELIGVSTIVRNTNEPGINGVVISTAPTSGNKVKNGDLVTLFISSGTASVIQQPTTSSEESEPSTDVSLPVDVIPPEIPIESSQGTSQSLENQSEQLQQEEGAGSFENGQESSAETTQGGQF
ncbi:MAG: PASTA domain-containing protein [Fervidobacterium sp.]|uniref:Serine/threonine protein kinase n=1 Tax=Fervidobacterium gondwanense DSM 13020 TaxID=1121883 RepID=A0A1M7RZN4_FERGO|nr:PASTA domain-containing protein [Fervidobacterium gondwanense]SHN51636.1 serine/threonine protein kinase [Fervidobacterium gondwanense DSM 13020]